MRFRLTSANGQTESTALFARGPFAASRSVDEATYCISLYIIIILLNGNDEACFATPRYNATNASRSSKTLGISTDSGNAGYAGLQQGAMQDIWPGARP